MGRCYPPFTQKQTAKTTRPSQKPVRKRSYAVLSEAERAQIECLKKAGLTYTKIAENLGRHKSTISREIRRNAGKRGYRCRGSQIKSDERRKMPRYRKMTPALTEYIDSKLKVQLSPEQISNTMWAETGQKISHERIYQHVAQDKGNGGDLYRNLRINNKRRYRRNRAKGDWRLKIPNRTDIDFRPKAVAARCEAGHWEADLVAINGGYLVSVVERSKRLLLLGSAPNKRADTVCAEMHRLLRRFKPLVKTITYDNGPEFSQHERLNELLGCASYFAKPYHSWERGSNENMNGLLRQYFPKNAIGSQMSSDNIQLAQERLNHRPRKTLGWLSPLQALFAANFFRPTVALGS